MAKPNFEFEKRRKELARKKKQEDKRKRKMEKSLSEKTADEQVVPQ